MLFDATVFQVNLLGDVSWAEPSVGLKLESWQSKIKVLNSFMMEWVGLTFHGRLGHHEGSPTTSAKSSWSKDALQISTPTVRGDYHRRRVE